MIRAVDGTILYPDEPLTLRQRAADAAHCLACLTVAMAVTGVLLTLIGGAS